ncbi:MAG: hypothetical protein AB7N80_13430 [Bdellovibrionales bacterium]
MNVKYFALFVISAGFVQASHAQIPPHKAGDICKLKTGWCWRSQAQVDNATTGECRCRLADLPIRNSDLASQDVWVPGCLDAPGTSMCKNLLPEKRADKQAANLRSRDNCGSKNLATFGKSYPPGTTLYWVEYKLEFAKEPGVESVEFVAFQTPNKRITDDEIMKLIRDHKKPGNRVTILRGATSENLGDSEYQAKQCDNWLRQKDDASVKPASSAK